MSVPPTHASGPYTHSRRLDSRSPPSFGPSTGQQHPSSLPGRRNSSSSIGSHNHRRHRSNSSSEFTPGSAPSGGLYGSHNHRRHPSKSSTEFTPGSAPSGGIYGSRDHRRHRSNSSSEFAPSAGLHGSRDHHRHHSNSSTEFTPGSAPTGAFYGSYESHGRSVGSCSPPPGECGYAIEMLIIYNKMFVSEGVCMSVPVLCAHVCQRDYEYEYERECD